MHIRAIFLASYLGVVLPGLAILGAPESAVAANPHTDEAAKAVAAVIAVDNHWLQAEVRGDTA